MIMETGNKKLKILAIDDSPTVLCSVSSMLGFKYKVFTLPKPAELKRALQKLTPDLFLLDYKMPEINGFELVPIIRGIKEHKDTPIVFLTSEGNIDNLTIAIALGANDFIVKPVKPKILYDKITKHIVKARPAHLPDEKKRGPASSSGTASENGHISRPSHRVHAHSLVPGHRAHLPRPISGYKANMTNPAPDHRAHVQRLPTSSKLIHFTPAPHHQKTE